MIVEEILSEALVRHYSDTGMKIRQEETGAVYDDAVDAIPCRYIYTETDIPVDDDTSAEEILNIILGVDE